VNGQHTLLKNKHVDVTVHVKNKLTTEANVKFHDVQTNEVICHIHITQSGSTVGEHKCEKHGIDFTITTVGTAAVYTIDYPAVKLLMSIRQNGNCPASCYYNVHVWQPPSLVEQSTGICGKEDPGCIVRAPETDEFEWEPVRSSFPRQFISNELAKSICHQYVDAFFIKTRRAPYQRNANLNNTIASVLDGCTDDLVLTGQIEMVRGSLDVLMMEELTIDATSIDSIKAVLQSDIEASTSMLNDAVKMGEARTRHLLN
jgi:hypothetical protein